MFSPSSKALHQHPTQLCIFIPSYECNATVFWDPIIDDPTTVATVATVPTFATVPDVDPFAVYNPSGTGAVEDPNFDDPIGFSTVATVPIGNSSVSLDMDFSSSALSPGEAEAEEEEKESGELRGVGSQMINLASWFSQGLYDPAKVTDSSFLALSQYLPCIALLEFFWPSGCPVSPSAAPPGVAWGDLVFSSVPLVASRDGGAFDSFSSRCSSASMKKKDRKMFGCSGIPIADHSPASMEKSIADLDDPFSSATVATVVSNPLFDDPITIATVATVATVAFNPQFDDPISFATVATVSSVPSASSPVSSVRDSFLSALPPWEASSPSSSPSSTPLLARRLFMIDDVEGKLGRKLKLMNRRAGISGGSSSLDP